MASTTVTPASVIEQLDQAPDVLTWLNNVLSPSTTDSDPGLPSLDALLTATSIAVQSTSSTLENTIDEIARATPRLAYDLHFTRDGALALQGALAQSIPQSNPDDSSATTQSQFDATSKVLERLQYLDTLKIRMEATRDVLREAESWGALEAEVTALLSERSYARAASRLSASARSMPTSRTLAGAAGTVQEPRRALLTSLANQLEAAVSPDLVRAITAGDVESCKSLYAIFVDIERESEFRNYYYGARRSPIVDMWNRTIVEGEAAPTGDQDAPQKLNVFYPTFLHSFLSMLDGERQSIPNIFPDPETTLASLIYNTLTVLTPSPNQRFASLFHGNGGSFALKDIVKLFQATEEFAKGTGRILEKLRISGPTTTPFTQSGEGKLSRRRSMRMSMSWRSTSVSGSGRQSNSTGGIGNGVEGTEWDQCLFQPFLDFQIDFGILERRLLDETLGLPLVTLQGVVDGDRVARAMRERAVDVVSVAEESIDRCMTFTHGYASVGLVRAIDGYVSSFVNAWTSYVADLANPSSASASNATVYSGSEDEEFADLDYTSQDWAHIQRALHLLAAARTVKERLGVFEIRLQGALSQVAMSFRTAGNGMYTPGVTKGEGMLLAQSTLNSVDLRELLSTVERARPSVLLSSAHSALTTFARTNQRTLQRVLLSPLFVHLSTYASLPLWSSARPQDLVPGLAGVSIPIFSLSPSEAIQRVGDGLLNLPRLFEVYAEDDALGFEIDALAGEDGLQSHSPSGDNTATAQRQQVHSPEAVTTTWLSFLGRNMLDHLTGKVLPQIRVLSATGSAQLAADLGYLSTIIRALGVEEGDLEQWKTYVGMGDEEGRAALADEDVNEVLALVARMRGWS
ncbi:oligomeric Golgi complex subunit 7 [Scleroderma yunnanense]